ncbi:MAG TPA: leucine--tRNA ligase [Alphaproteobacteria bacterium]|nr:leucine--tRNA ligase [Alphaproteobacteria bacterium]
MLGDFRKAGESYAQNFHELEEQAQQWWKAENVYHTPDSPHADNKRYILGMFPYPSGNAHMGHVRVYSITDMIARHSRFKGRDVLHPLGWDSFGLPAENAAFKNNVHPAEWTDKNIVTMRDEQIGRVGFSFDLDRELATSSPEYYKWTQWLFLKLYEHGKVYRSLEWVNWDPIDKTVLANEQVIDGKGWRSGAPIERRQMEQWYIRITDYAEDLALGIDKLDGWSDAAKGAQRNWIGRSEGALVHFKIAGTRKTLKAFTTRPELSFGVSALVLAPENDSILEICTEQQRDAVSQYIKDALLRPEVDRISSKVGEGVFTGVDAIHPLTGERIPVFVADYVLNTYADGVATCVPAHNEKDYSFSEKMGLPVTPVMSDPANDRIPYSSENGLLKNSGFLDGMSVLEARKAILEYMTSNGCGEPKIEYRLRDWSLSRQRFWGSPIPMLKKPDGTWKPVPIDELPVELPKDADFSDSHGRSPLATNPDFLQVPDNKTGETLERATDTMDTFMCSSWYAWRFTDPHNSKAAWNPDLGNSWMPIDTYVGGLEHANQHMIYFRFMSHFLHDIGLTNSKEPIRCFLDNGLVRLDGAKMSKSKGNIVRPDEMVDKFGADALRMYILSDVPFNRDIEWSEEGLENKFDFLKRIDGLFRAYSAHAPNGIASVTPADVKDEWSVGLLNALQSVADKTDADIEKTYAFHNVVARTHELANKLFSERNNVSTPERQKVYAYAMQNFLKILSLSAPHLSDVLFRNTFKVDQSLFHQPWIQVNPDCLVSKSADIQIPVTVNGKKRGMLSVPREASDDEIREGVINSQDSILKRIFDETTLGKVIVVRDKLKAPKLINVVTREIP